MNSQLFGTLVNQSQLEIHHIQKQLQFVQELISQDQQPGDELMFLYEQLKQNVTKLNQRVTKRVESVYQNIINPQEQTIQQINNKQPDEPDNKLNGSKSNSGRPRAVSFNNQPSRIPLMNILESQNLDPRGKNFCSNNYRSKKQSYLTGKKSVILPAKEVSQSFQYESLKDSIHQQPSKMYNQQLKNQRQMVQNDFFPDLKIIKADFQILIKQQRYAIPQPKPLQNIVDISINRIEKDLPKSIAAQTSITMEQTFKIVKGKRVMNSELDRIKSLNPDQQASINYIIGRLERLLWVARVNVAIIDIRKLMKFSLLKKRVPISQLVLAINNKEELEPGFSEFLKDKIFLGKESLQKAAIKIQSRFRGYIERKKVSIDLAHRKSARKIQVRYRIYKELQRTRKRIYDNNQRSYQDFLKMQEQFKIDWVHWQFQPRIEVHVASCSYQEYTRLTMEKFLQRENQQICRIFRAKDELLNIIYLIPFELNDDLYGYYDKIFQINNIKNFNHRVRFLTPELCDRFPSHFSLLQKLLYSPKCLKKIIKIIKGRQSYIVPSSCSNEYIKLAMVVGIPLYGGEPQKHFINSTKSGSRVLFTHCNIPIPPGANEIYEETELINTLTVLIVNNPEIRTWILKTDDTFGSRGLATYSIESIQGLKGIVKRAQKGNLTEAIISVVKKLIQNSLPNKLKIIYKRLHIDYKEFMAAFLSGGGIIEACPPKQQISKLQCPSVFFEINPLGLITLIGSYDKIQGQSMINVAYSYPQFSLDQDLQPMCVKVGKHLYQQGIFGFIAIDLMVFYQNTEPTIWAIGLDCFMNKVVSAYFYFDFLVCGQLNSTGQYIVGDSKRHFLYCPFITHPRLSQTHMKTFFHMCRLEGIAYDIDEKEGCSFILPDIIQSGFISIITIGQSFLKTIEFINVVFVFIGKLVGDMSTQYGQSIAASRDDLINISDIYGKLKCLEQNLKKINDI